MLTFQDEAGISIPQGASPESVCCNSIAFASLGGRGAHKPSILRKKKSHDLFYVYGLEKHPLLDVVSDFFLYAVNYINFSHKSDQHAKAFQLFKLEKPFLLLHF